MEIIGPHSVPIPGETIKVVNAVPTANKEAPTHPVSSGAPTPPPTTAPAPRHVVDFKKVTKKFGEKTVLEDVDFSVADIEGEGEFVTIVGQSGCGKSTLCKLIAGLDPHHPPTSGDVLSFGERISGPSADRGVVDQKYSLLPNLTVADNVSFGLKLRGMGKIERRDMSRVWIEKIGLAGSEDKYPFELSGGMQQRVAIAASLVLRPRILIMDEPFGALDPKIRIQMQSLLLDLWREQSSTVFFVTHSAEEAVYLGDRVVRMTANPGKVCEIIQVPRPDRPLAEMRKEKNFREVCDHLRETLEKP